MKTLLLMRHAKSDWEADYEGDHERPLNERGIESARVMGRVLSDEALNPDLIIASTAVRARTTAELAAESGGWDCEIQLDQRLYNTGTDGVVQVAGAAPAVDRLMLVGHQPTWSILVTVLTGEQTIIKTATVAVIEFGIERWDEIAAERGELNRVIYPRDFLDDD